MKTISFTAEELGALSRWSAPGLYGLWRAEDFENGSVRASVGEIDRLINELRQHLNREVAASEDPGLNEAYYLKAVAAMDELSDLIGVLEDAAASPVGHTTRDFGPLRRDNPSERADAMSRRGVAAVEEVGGVARGAMAARRENPCGCGGSAGACSCDTCRGKGDRMDNPSHHARFRVAEDDSVPMGGVVWRSGGAAGHHRFDNPAGVGDWRADEDYERDVLDEQRPPCNACGRYTGSEAWRGDTLREYLCDKCDRRSKMERRDNPAHDCACLRGSTCDVSHDPATCSCEQCRRGEARVRWSGTEAEQSDRWRRERARALPSPWERRDNPVHSLGLRHAPAEVENPSEDEHEADMLVIAADSDGTLYPMKKEIVAALAKKRRRGDYDTSRAAQAFSYYIDEAARVLARERAADGEDSRTWTAQFPKRVRRLAAEQVARSSESELLIAEREADANKEIYAERSPAEGGRSRRDNPLYPALGPASDMSGGSGARRDNPTTSGAIPLKLLQPRLGNPVYDNPLEPGCSQGAISENIGRELHAHPEMPVKQGAAIAYSHARRQGCMIPMKKGTRRKNPADLSVANTIAQQMGGIPRLTAMIGAKNFLGDKDMLQFKWSAKSKKKINTVRIQLEPSDTYKVTFYSLKGFDISEVSGWDDVQASELRPLFERETGLALSL